MCLYPRIGDNKRYVANKKNGGVIPAFSDSRVLKVPIPCGRCMECRNKEARNWSVRLMEDIKHHRNAKIVTLTLTDEMVADYAEAAKYKIKGGGKDRVKVRVHLEGYELDNEIATIAVRRFTERWRKEFKKAPRHWLITELGHNGTENVHLHGMIWTDESSETIRKHWKAFVRIDKKQWVNGQTINYMVKYVKKQDNDHKEYKAKVLNSKGIGGDYVITNNARLNKYRERVGQNKTRESYRQSDGRERALPTYWRNKIYSDEEKEKLWIEKLDENVRWVNGYKIDISKGEEEYYKVLKREQIRNNRLGYGNDEKNWKQKAYEKERRAIMIKKRIDRANEKKGVFTEKVTEEQNKIIGWGMPSRVDTCGATGDE